MQVALTGVSLLGRLTSLFFGLAILLAFAWWAGTAEPTATTCVELAAGLTAIVATFLPTNVGRGRVVLPLLLTTPIAYVLLTTMNPAQQGAAFLSVPLLMSVLASLLPRMYRIARSGG